MKRDIKTLDDAHDILSIHGIEKSRSIVRDAPEGVESYSWVLGESSIRDKEVWICDLKDALKIIDNENEMANLPLYASIAQSQRRLFDDEHLAKDIAHADLICCVNCSGYGYIELGANQCPSCECTDCLMDIQESDVKESDCE